MKTNGKNGQDKPGGWYYLTDAQRDFVVKALRTFLPEETARDTLDLYETLRNKQSEPALVFSQTVDQSAVEGEARSKM